MPIPHAPYTGEFSFMLGPATDPAHGLGIIAMRDIQPGEDLTDTLFPYGYGSVVRHEDTVPPEFIKYCVARPDGMLVTPPTFGAIDTGWFGNHARLPNVLHGDDRGRDGEPIGHDRFVAAGLILAGTELTYNYNHLGEPPEAKKPYYAGDCNCPSPDYHTIAPVPANAKIL